MVAAGQKAKYPNGVLQPMKERKKSLKGSPMVEYRIDCEECESTTHVQSYDEPEFCPVCGRRAEAEKLKAELDDLDWN